MESNVEICCTTFPTDLVTVNWTNQSLNILKRLQILIASEGIYKKEVTINCDGGSVDCNKLLLCLCSGFFANLMKDQNADSKIIISMPTVSAEIFNYLYEYMLNGKVELPSEKVTSFYEIAKDLKVGEMIDTSTTVVIGENRGDTCSETRSRRMANNENSTPLEVILTPSTSSSSGKAISSVIVQESFVDRSQETSSVCVYNPYNGEELVKGSVRDEETPRIKLGLKRKDASDGQNALKQCCGTNLRKNKTNSSTSIDSNANNDISEDPATHSQQLPTRVYDRRNMSKIRRFSQMNKQGNQKKFNFSQSLRQVEGKTQKSNLFYKGRYYSSEEAKKISVKCPNCRVQIRLFELMWHEFNVCKAKKSVKKSEKNECIFEDCHFSSSTIEEARAHIATHKDKFYCNICQLIFTTAGNRSSHKRECEGSLASTRGNLK